jgi:hypothetical protein
VDCRFLETEGELWNFGTGVGLWPFKNNRLIVNPWNRGELKHLWKWRWIVESLKQEVDC